MSAIPKAVARLIDEFAKLPGVGPKTASRLTFYLLRAPEEQVQALADALYELRRHLVTCSRCFNIGETNPCGICSDTSRDQATVCVVEEPLDVIAIERTGAYKGLYHVLHGAISPVDGILPQDLRIRELVQRVKQEPIEEVILATNPTLEGEATAHFVQSLLAGHNIRLTKIAHGVPLGGELEYIDQNTLAHALSGRKPLEGE